VAERKSAQERAEERDAEQARLEQERASTQAGTHMRAPDEPARGQDRNARRTGDQDKAEPGLPSPVRAEDRDQEEYDREMSGRRRGRRGDRDPEREEYDRERERDKDLPLEERRPEFLTEEERTEQVEHIHNQYPKGYSPTANLGE
jgi:hypothetical protein